MKVLLIIASWAIGTNIYGQNLRPDLQEKLVKVLSQKLLLPKTSPTGDTRKLCHDRQSSARKLQIDSSKIEILLERPELVISDLENGYFGKVSFTLTRIKDVSIPERVSLITFSVENSWTEGPEGGQDFLISRYFAKIGQVSKVSSAGMGDTMNVDQLERLVESELLHIYAATKIEEIKETFDELSAPYCQLNFSDAPKSIQEWKFRTLTRQQQGLEEKTVAKETVWMRKGDPAVYVKSPDQMSYAYLPKRPLAFDLKANHYICFTDAGKREATSDQQRHILLQYDLTGLIPEADIKGLGKVYRRAEDPEVKTYYDAVVKSYSFAEGRMKKAAPAEKDFQKALPILYAVDPLTRVYQCRAKNLMFDYSRFVEPLIYVYTKDEKTVSVALDPSVQIDSSVPQHIENSWTFRANAQGDLRFPGGAKAFQFLFWEGRQERFPRPPVAGQVVRAQELGSFFASILPQLGLNATEALNFKEYWLPELQKHPQVLIDFILNDDVSEYVPLKIVPSMSQIRIYLNYRPIRDAHDSYEQKLFPRLIRPSGDLLVEWGGVQWAQGEAF